MVCVAVADRALLIERVLDAQEQLMLAFQRGAQPRWLHLDLTMQQLKALLVLHQTGTRPVGQLGHALEITRPAASLLVDALVRLGLVERVEDERDRRRTLVSLTATARELVAQLYQWHRERFEHLLAQLGDDELGALARGIEALAKAAGDPGSTPTTNPSAVTGVLLRSLTLAETSRGMTERGTD